MAADYAFAIARRTAASGAAGTALRYFVLGLRYAARPLASEHAAGYANVLQHAARSTEAAAFLRAELREAIECGDAARAADLSAPFASVMLSLERDVEFGETCARIAALPALGDRGREQLRTAQLMFAAFAGRFEECRAVASRSDATPRDHRIAAFVYALDGEPKAAEAAFQRYAASLRPRESFQDPADMVLQGVIGLQANGTRAIADLADVSPAETEPYRGLTYLRALARIYEGRWAEARDLIEQQPFWREPYEEPVHLLDARLMLAALSRREPSHRRRTLNAIRALIARGQVRHAVSPARWYVLGAARTGASGNDELSAFVHDTLDIAPMTYLVTASDLAVALLKSRFGAERCLHGISAWPHSRSRWAKAQDVAARAILSGDRDALRSARDELTRLGARALAMIVGLELPVPRATDIALARALGYTRYDAPQPGRGALTPRESDVAELAAQGLANREIAARLAISERTVEVHLSNAYRKIGTRSRTGLAHALLFRTDQIGEDR